MHQVHPIQIQSGQGKQLGNNSRISHGTIRECSKAMTHSLQDPCNNLWVDYSKALGLWHSPQLANLCMLKVSIQLLSEAISRVLGLLLRRRLSNRLVARNKIHGQSFRKSSKRNKSLRRNWLVCVHKVRLTLLRWAWSLRIHGPLFNNRQVSRTKSSHTSQVCTLSPSAGRVNNRVRGLTQSMISSSSSPRRSSSPMNQASIHSLSVGRASSKVHGPMRSMTNNNSVSSPNRKLIHNSSLSEACPQAHGNKLHRYSNQPSNLKSTQKPWVMQQALGHKLSRLVRPQLPSRSQCINQERSAKVHGKRRSHSHLSNLHRNTT